MRPVDGSEQEHQALVKHYPFLEEDLARGIGLFLV